MTKIICIIVIFADIFPCLYKPDVFIQDLDLNLREGKKGGTKYKFNIFAAKTEVGVN